MAELRKAKAAKIKQFNARTKKMRPADRKNARRDFKAKVAAQFKQITKRFPTARGIKETGALQALTKQLAAVRSS